MHNQRTHIDIALMLNAFHTIICNIFNVLFSYGIVSIEYGPVVHEDVLLVQEYNDTTWFVPF